MGELADDATLAARRIAVFSTGLYASPAYLQRRGMPPEPEALMEHDALRLLTRSGEPEPWLLSRGEAQWQGTPPGRATANSPDLLMRLARAGAGIARQSATTSPSRIVRARRAARRCSPTGGCRRRPRGRCSRGGA